MVLTRMRSRRGLPLVIGGLEIEHSEGLAGHSDGDVLLHAITDALLGAVSAGDIGTFFPPSDERWKGAASSLFLRTAMEEIHTAGFRIVNLDTCLVLMKPKIVPIAGEMRERVAELLEIKPHQVGIKAKTPEGLNQDGGCGCVCDGASRKPGKRCGAKENRGYGGYWRGQRGRREPGGRGAGYVGTGAQGTGVRHG